MATNELRVALRLRAMAKLHRAQMRADFPTAWRLPQLDCWSSGFASARSWLATARQSRKRAAAWDAEAMEYMQEGAAV